MASHSSSLSASIALFLCLSLLIFTFTRCQQLPVTCRRGSVTMNACAAALKPNTTTIGNPPAPECCTLIQGMVAFEAAVCICTVLDMDGIEVPMALTIVLNSCGTDPPPDFNCQQINATSTKSIDNEIKN